MRVTKKVKAEQLRRLSEVYKNDGTMLHFTSPFTLLVAVILSAQCTDKRVNVITNRIFPRLDTPAKMVSLTQGQLETEIHDCGLYKAKAKNLLGMCRMLLSDYHGEVPENHRCAAIFTAIATIIKELSISMKPISKHIP